MVKAQNFIEENPEQTYEYLSEDSGLSVEEVEKTVTEFELYLKLDDEVKESVVDTYNFLKSEGILETDIDDLESHFDDSFVNAAVNN